MAEDPFCYMERETLLFLLHFLRSGFCLCPVRLFPSLQLCRQSTSSSLALPMTHAQECMQCRDPRDEMAVSILFGESSPQKDHGCGVPLAPVPSPLHSSAGRLPGVSPRPGCLRALANMWASLGWIHHEAPPTLCRNACAILACSYHELKLLGSLRNCTLQAVQTQLT